MDRKDIVFVPTPGCSDSQNLFVRNMLELLSQKYHVTGMEQVSNDFKRMKKVRAVILNWAETELNSHMKRQLLMYQISGAKLCWIFHNRIPHDCKNALEIRNIQWLADHSNCIFLLSKSSKRYLPHRKRNSKKCIYLPHIHYIGAYPICDRDIRKEYAIEEDTFVFAFLGLLRPYKNLEVLVQAFCELAFENARLLIAGNVQDGAYIEELRKKCQASESIILKPGFISNSEMEAYIRAGDVLVLPYSKVSSMNSGAMIMAFSYGRTVIVPEIAMGKDIKEKKIAFIYDYTNEKENLEHLKAKMLEAYLRGKKEVHDMGGRARRYVEKNNNKRRVMNAVERAVHEQ